MVVFLREIIPGCLVLRGPVVLWWGQVFLSLGLFMICLEWVFGVGLFKIGLV